MSWDRQGHGGGGCGGGWVLQYFHLYVGLTHFLGFNIFGGFLKNEYFGGMKKLWIFLGGHYKTRLFFLGGGGRFYTF